MPPSPYGPIEGSEEGDIMASKGPQFFAAFTATMGEFAGQGAALAIAQPVCSIRYGEMATSSPGNLVMGTAISWTSPAGPMLARTPQVRLHIKEGPWPAVPVSNKMIFFLSGGRFRTH